MIESSLSNLQEHIRAIYDWPKSGVVFRDIAPLLYDKQLFRQLIDSFIYRYIKTDFDAIVGIDARGFIIGAPVAYQLVTSFVPVRKKGKLPSETISEPYSLEYGEAEVEIQTDALQKGQRVLLIDDLIATGGTMLASAKLIERLGAEIIEVATIIDLPDIGGSDKLRQAGLKVHSICQFEGG